MFFEILNEPHNNLTSELWNEYLAESINVVRQSNPGRTLVIGAADWGGFAAGANVESWLVHYDPVGSDHVVDADAGIVEFTFEEVILGIDHRSDTLDAGDAMFGAAGIEYRQGEEFRGTELSEHDGIQVSADGHSVVFDLKVWYANADEFRIFTGGWDDLNSPTPNPEPGTLVLCGAGIAYFIWRRRR